MSRPSVYCCVTLAAFMAYVPQAHAYIDPGIAYGLIQAVFAILFGGAVAWVLRPWNYLRSLFRSRRADEEAEPASGRPHRGDGKS